MWLRSLDINEGDEHHCGADSGGTDHPPDELSEPAVSLFAVVGYTIERWRRFAVESVIDGFEGGVHGVFWLTEGARKRCM
jgi:hypothetical protein